MVPIIEHALLFAHPAQGMEREPVQAETSLYPSFASSGKCDKSRPEREREKAIHMT